MLDEKTMVSDTLTGVNGELVRYGEMISQTENSELKQCLKQIRNECDVLYSAWRRIKLHGEQRFLWQKVTCKS